jgi:hypothetical protein
VTELSEKRVPGAAISWRAAHKTAHGAKLLGFEGCHLEAALGVAEPKLEGSSLPNRLNVADPRGAPIQLGRSDDHEQYERERP